MVVRRGSKMPAKGKGRLQQEAYDRAMAAQRAQPCKDKDHRVASDGSCLRCGAVQGQVCKAPTK